MTSHNFREEYMCSFVRLFIQKVKKTNTVLPPSRFPKN